MQARPHLPAMAEEAAEVEADQPTNPSPTLCNMPSQDLLSWKMMQGA